MWSNGARVGLELANGVNNEDPVIYWCFRWVAEAWLEVCVPSVINDVMAPGRMKIEAERIGTCQSKSMRRKWRDREEGGGSCCAI